MKSVPNAVYAPRLFLLFLICGISLPALSGLLVFPFSFTISPDMELIYRIGLSIVFLLSTIFSYRKEQYKKYWHVLFAFFIAFFATNLQATSAFLNLETIIGNMNSIVLSMLSSTLLVGIPIIVFARISGDSMGSIFLKKGNIRLGLIIGLIGFFVFLGTSVEISTFLFQGQNLSFERVIAWTLGYLPL